MNKENITLLQHFIIVTFILFLLFFLWIFLLFKWIDFLFNMTEESENNSMSIVNIYEIVWDYVIGNRKKAFFGWDIMEYDTICNIETKVCLGWEVKWVKVEGGTIYIYFTWQYTNMDFKSNIRWKDYPLLYSFWWSERTHTPEHIDDLKQFWIFVKDSVEFYSLYELRDLTQGEEKIFLDLRENPKFIF